jgi:riboflavin biosynthesis pyrimidine reductase
LLRSYADMILVGAGTVRIEAYRPPALAEEIQATRVRRGQAPVPRVAIVSASLNLDFSTRLFTESDEKPLVITRRHCPRAGGRLSAIAPGS